MSVVKPIFVMKSTADPNVLEHGRIAMMRSMPRMIRVGRIEHRIMQPFLVTLVWLALTSAAAAMPQQDAVDHPRVKPQTPDALDAPDALDVTGTLDVAGLQRVSPDNEVWFSEKNQSVVVGGEVSLDQGPLEMFACPKGTKEYESIVAVNSKAFVIHAALLAVGAKSGHPVRFHPNYSPATGSRIRVDVQWKDDRGKWRSASAKDWVQDVATKAALKEDWVFAGSGFWKDPDTGDEFYHAEGGELVCVSNFSTAMMDLPIESSDRDSLRLYQAFTENVPPIGTRVKLTLTPIAPSPASMNRSEDSSDDASDRVK